MNFIVIEGKISPKVTRARSRGGEGEGGLSYGVDGDACRKSKRDQTGRGRSLYRPLKETSQYMN